MLGPCHLPSSPGAKEGLGTPKMGRDSSPRGPMSGGSPGGTLARPGQWLRGEPVSEPVSIPRPAPSPAPASAPARLSQPRECAGGQDPSKTITGDAWGPLDTGMGPQTGGVTCGYPQGVGWRVQPDH